MKIVLILTYCLSYFYCSQAFSQEKQIPVRITVNSALNGKKADTTFVVKSSITTYTKDTTIALLKDTTYLQNLSGNYLINNVGPEAAVVKVSLDKKLRISLPNQGEYDLIPVIPILFDVNGLDKVRVLFFLDNLGKSRAINIIYDGKIKKHINAVKK